MHHPPNDAFASATPWTTYVPEDPAQFAGTAWTGSLVGASTETGEPGTATRTIWYRVGSTAGGVLALSDNLAAGLSQALYEGTSVDDLTLVPLISDNSGTVWATLEPGNQYQLQVSASAELAAGGLFYLFGQPSNDTFAGARLLGPAGTTQARLLAATREPGEPSPADCASAPKTEWYAITPANASRLDMTLVGPFNPSALATCLTLYEGSSLGGLSQLATATASGGLATIGRNLAAGTTYHIAVAGGSLVNPGRDFPTYGLTWSLTPPTNDAPSITGATVVVAEDGSVTIDLATSDPDDDPLTYSIDISPAHGQAVLGTRHGDLLPVTYTPAPNFHGSDSFVVSVTDGEFTASATVNVTVTSVNDAPIASADHATTTVGQAVVIDLVGNDTDVDLDVLGIDTAGQGAFGSVTIIPAAPGRPTSVRYTPNARFAGTDHFGYVVGDGAGGTATGQVDVVVRDVTAPVIVVPADITVTTSAAAGIAVTFAVSATDDVDATPAVTCAPQSGSIFPVGQTVVTCSSVDNAGNQATRTFKVTVIRPPTMVLTLTVTQQGGTGQPAGALGTVSSSPAGFAACLSKTTCTAPFATDAVVTLTATPKGSGYFQAWTGCDTASGYVCTVKMSAARAVAAQFSVTPPAREFRIVGIGAFATSPAGPTTIVLDASRYVNATFSGSAIFSVGSATYASTGITALSRSGNVIQIAGTARKVVSGSPPTVFWTLTITDNKLPNADKAVFKLTAADGSLITSTGGVAKPVLGAFVVQP